MSLTIPGFPCTCAHHEWQRVYGHEEDDAAEVGLLTLYKGRDIMDYSNVLTVVVLVAIATLWYKKTRKR